VAWWAVAIILLAGASTQLPKGVRAVKGWQARRLSGEALVLIDQQNWGDAIKKVRAGFQLRYSEPEVWHAYARLLSRTGQGTLAVEWWQKITGLQSLSAQDHRDYAMAAIYARELGIASEQVAQLLAQPNGPSPTDLQLAGQLSTLRGYNSTAVKYAEQILSDNRSSPRELLNGNLLILSNTPRTSDSYKEAFARVLQIGRDESNPASAQALSVIAQQRAPTRLTLPATESLELALPESSGTSMSLNEIADRLKNNTNSRAYHHMLAMELRLRAEPGRESELVATAIRLYSDGDDETLIALGSWLFSHRRFQSLLEVIPIQRAEQRRELLMERIDALAALGRLTDVKELLLTEHAVLDSAFQHMYLAIVRRQLGEVTAAANEWLRALDTAGSPRALLGLADYAEKMGNLEIADAAYARLVKRQPELKSAYISRFQVAQERGRTAEAHDFAVEIVRLWPEDDATRMREIYLRLLLDPDQAVAHSAEEEAAQHVAGNPWDGAARSAVALAQLRQQKAAAALNTLTEFTPGVPSSAVSQAVYAAALDANGWKDKAREQTRQLETENILPEERALIAPTLNP
jgi:Tfp pilus assembly protein PilF